MAVHARRTQASGPCRGIVTGIYTTSSPEACQYIAQDCRASIIVVDTQKQLEKILKVWGRGRGMGGTSSVHRTFHLPGRVPLIPITPVPSQTQEVGGRA